MGLSYLGILLSRENRQGGHCVLHSPEANALASNLRSHTCKQACRYASLDYNRIKNGRSIVKNSASAVALCNFRSIKVENLRFSPFNQSFLFYFRFLAFARTLCEHHRICGGAMRYAERWFGARRAIGARALASKLADALRLIISRKFLHQIRSPLGAVLIKNSLCI